MTFGARIKEEITKNLDNPSESLVSLSAYLKFNTTIDDKIAVYVENPAVARWLFKLIKYHYNIPIVLITRTIKRFRSRNLYILEVKEKIDIIKADVEMTFDNVLNLSNEEKIAFLKGLFLSCGSINDPKTNLYHLEFLVKEEEIANLINDILLSLNFKSKVLKREREYMVYIKVSENISDFIKYLGATEALFYFEDIRIYKDHKNMVNRLNNCEQANVEKSMKSSQAILKAVSYLEEYDIINLLDERTNEIIAYKKKYPETSLTELAEIISMEPSKKLSIARGSPIAALIP